MPGVAARTPAISPRRTGRAVHADSCDITPDTACRFITGRFGVVAIARRAARMCLTAERSVTRSVVIGNDHWHRRTDMTMARSSILRSRSPGARGVCGHCGVLATSGVVRRLTRRARPQRRCRRIAEDPGDRLPRREPARLAAGALDDLAAAVWVQGYDAAWLGGDWRTLGRRLAADVALLSPELEVWLAGRRAVLTHLRAMMRGARVHEYNATDLKGLSSGPVGIISYRWQLDWTRARRRRQSLGRDLLVLRSAAGEWQLLRRLPLRS